MTTKTTNILINSFFITVIAVVTFAITAFSLAKKMSDFEHGGGLAAVTLQKKEFSLVSFSSGSVILTTPVGRHVKKGEVLVRLNNETIDRQIQVLETFDKTNVSAQTQLALLRSEKENQTIYAPTDGIVATLVSEGEVIKEQEVIGTVYADTGIQLTGKITLDDYKILLKNTDRLKVIDRRLNQTYNVNFGGLQEQLAEADYSPDVLQAYFTFNDPADAANLLQHEYLQLDLRGMGTTEKPFTRIVNFYERLTQQQ